ncbi:hypothetical protein A1O1_04553 [Capronia coronata CBS 617.96]|uniref:Major facilitator superfamily (MFS) profile domain-containing protein n=1 Tax=Capronia coronata CBS 617.96 TaxID=1182541 RepID=W9YQC2_9EURO|nr:uncharacterized protein A1O1_04553 [Capronia coronata CBS 617.96]EXJ91441.1 hypothetical protein A1O1_04553 [Capronia coronata CBS 617.96]
MTEKTGAKVDMAPGQGEDVQRVEPLCYEPSMEEGKLKNLKDADVALQYVYNVNATPIDAETDKRIRRTIDWHILPWMFGIYLLQYLDKTTLSYAAIMGIRSDLNIASGQYAWAGSVFYFGYLAFEYPHNRLMQRLPLMKYVSVTVFFWGLTLCLHAATTSFATLMVARFFLGAFEGSVTAGFILMTARWYRAEEQVTRTSYWFCANGFAQIVGGAVAYGVARGFADNPSITFPSWKVIFIITGIITALYSVGMYFFLPDSPINAKWLSETDRAIAVERLRGNQQGLGSKTFKWYQFREALTDPKSWLYCLFACTSMIPPGGLTVFFTLLIQGYGFDSTTTLLVSMPSGAVEVWSTLFFPWLAYKMRNGMLSACLSMLLGLFAIALMTGLARDGPTAHRIGQLVGYYILLGNSATSLLIIFSSISSNVAGYTKKTTVNAMMLIAYCVGFIIGPQTFRDGPYYTNAKYDTIAQLFVALACCVALLYLYKRDNARRDALNLPPQPAGQEFLDLTDNENKYFRYTV